MLLSPQCRSVAAVVLGDPKKIELVPTNVANRFQMLHDRSIDLQCDSVTHTIEREVREVRGLFAMLNVFLLR